MTLELHATPHEVMRAVEAFEEFARAQSVPEKIIYQLQLALEECASNIVDHGLQRDARQKFHVTFGRAGDEVFIELRDKGPEFDPTKKAESEKARDEDTIGGWGIQLVRRSVDDIRYQRQNGENVLRLSKRLA
jgi:anti-sigma regulatory factor (Ser/Thr protein kinase)